MARLTTLLALFAVFCAHEPIARSDEPAPRRLLLLGQGPDGHAASTHEFLAGLKIIKTCLDRVRGIDARIVDTTGAWPDGPVLIDQCDGVVLFLAEGAKWIHLDEARLEALSALNRGAGQSAVSTGGSGREAKHVAEYVALVGGCHGGPDRKYAIVEVRTEIAAPKHPIMTAVDATAVRDEFYYRLKFTKSEKEVTPLLQVPIEGESHTVAWAWERPRAGSFGFSGLHFHDNWRHEGYRRMVVQGIAWTLARPIPEQGLNVDIEPAMLQLP